MIHAIHTAEIAQSALTPQPLFTNKTIGRVHPFALQQDLTVDETVPLALDDTANANRPLRRRHTSSVAPHTAQSEIQTTFGAIP